MSKSRNPKIFELFTRMDLVEKVGSGIPRIAAEMKAAGLPAPKYKTDGYFATILYKAKPALPSIVEEKTKKTREKTRETIRKKMKENPKITTQNLASQIGVNVKTIEWHIKKMKEQGVLERKGPDKGGEWILMAYDEDERR